MNLEEKTARSTLNEYCQQQSITPIYSWRKTGPSHMPTFELSIEVENSRGKGTGLSKKIAEENAAKDILDNLKISRETRYLSPGPSVKCANNKIGELNEITQKYKLDPPTYNFEEEGPSHNKTFTCRAAVGNLNATGSGKNKKEAKMAAAEGLLRQLICSKSEEDISDNLEIHEKLENVHVERDKAVLKSDDSVCRSVPLGEIEEEPVKLEVRRSGGLVAEISRTDPLVMDLTDNVNEFSDDESDSYLEFLDLHDRRKSVINRRMTPCRKRIQRLFNSKEVYSMSGGKRGRCVIINNSLFDNNNLELLARHGSNIDCENLEKCFKSLKFDVIIYQDKSSEEMLDIIKKETERNEHVDLGIFAVVLMSHGGHGQIYGCDSKPVYLTQIYSLLSAYDFPAMSGKPKLVVVQACSGDARDYMGYDTSRMEQDLELESSGDQPMSDCCSIPSISPPPPGSQSSLKDFIIVKSSMDGYISHRTESHGCLFVRALVDTLYKHSCHSDLVRMLRHVRQKVDCKSRQIRNSQPMGTKYPVSGQLPDYSEYLQDGRKLYLFPGYDAH